MDHLLVHRCNIQTRTTSANTLGEPTFTWSNTYTDVPCRFSTQKGGMFRLESGEFVSDMHELFLKASQTVTETNRIVGTSGFTGTYEILKVKELFGSDKLHHKELDLREVVD